MQEDSQNDMPMTFGVNRYAAFCQATGKIGTEFVMMASTFFGPSQHYLEDWVLPDGGMPRDNKYLEGWALEKDLPLPNIGEEFPEYRKRLKATMKLRGEAFLE